MSWEVSAMKKEREDVSQVEQGTSQKATDRRELRAGQWVWTWGQMAHFKTRDTVVCILGSFVPNLVPSTPQVLNKYFLN